MWTVPRAQSFAWKWRDWVCVVVYSLNYLQYQHKEQNNGAKWDLASQLPVGWITFHVLCCQRRITPEFSLSNMNNGRCEGLPVCYCSVYCLLICFGVVFWNWTEVVSRSSYIIFFFSFFFFRDVISKCGRAIRLKCFQMTTKLTLTSSRRPDLAAGPQTERK